MSNIDIKPRRCLKCLKDFLSEGPGNRICKRCFQKHRRLYQTASESELQAQRGRKCHNGDPMELEGDS